MRMRGRDVVRLEGDVVAQVWRNPRDEELPEGKHLVAVDHATVTVGMIYDGSRFSKPAHPVSPVIVVKEAAVQAGITPFSIPPPLPRPVQDAIAAPSSVVVNVHKDGAVTEDGVARHPRGSRPGNTALSESVPGQQGGEPAASAAPHLAHSNVASQSYPGEYNDNHQQDPAFRSEIQHPVININASIDDVRREAAEYIERQAHGVLSRVPQSKEVVREAIRQTVLQAEAMLSKCSNQEQVKKVVQASALAMADYIDQSNSGRVNNG